MKLSAEEQVRLEQLISKDLSALPALKAPQSLQARVWAQIERRAALPWWRRSFEHWPMSMRGAFFLTAMAMVWLTLSLTAWVRASRVAAQLSAPVASNLWGLQTFGSVAAALGNMCREVGNTLLHHIPGVWLYGGIAVLITMYAMLAGIGVAAYRTFNGTPTRA